MESFSQMWKGFQHLGNGSEKTSLDELPERWNILKGDMSLGVPLPLRAQYLDYYSEKENVAIE